MPLTLREYVSVSQAKPSPDLPTLLVIYILDFEILSVDVKLNRSASNYETEPGDSIQGIC